MYQGLHEKKSQRKSVLKFFKRSNLSSMLIMRGDTLTGDTIKIYLKRCPFKLCYLQNVSV